MLMDELISVIMLTYNRENLLSKMIECVLAQTYRNLEFIIVDNGSTDNSGKIADEYASRDDRIKVVHLGKETIGKGRNVGLDNAKGVYIAFVDDDDSLSQEYLESLYRNIIESQADVAICGAADKAFDVKEIYSPEDAVEVLLDRKRYNVAFPTKLIKKELFKENRFNEISKYDDIYLMPRILASAKRVVYEGRPMYEFYRHENNNSSWTTNFKLLTKETLQEYLDVYRERTEWLIERFPEKTATWQYFEWSFWISMVDKVERYDIKDCADIGIKLKNHLIHNVDDFVNNVKTQAFEKEWIAKYIAKI
ncbi:MAG: glycosyltransferase [Lachnospiraceae bacterium]|nr:glycosyltransferase [Lachnospiraceae bacterium]